MNKERKAAVVDEIADQIRAADAVFAVDYRGLSVAQAADLRAKLREADAKLRIVKNSLTERAADKAGVESLKDLLEGPTALALVHGDPALAAKALSDAGRTMHILEFKGGLMTGASLSADDVRAIARLPARGTLHSQLVGTIAAPLTGLVRGLNALVAGLAIQLQQIADQGLVSGAAPEPEAEATGEAEAEPAPEPEARAEPDPAAEPSPEPEAAAEPSPEPEAAAEPSREPEPAENESEREPEQDGAPAAEPSDA